MNAHEYNIDIDVIKNMKEINSFIEAGSKKKAKTLSHAEKALDEIKNHFYTPGYPLRALALLNALLSDEKVGVLSNDEQNSVSIFDSFSYIVRSSVYYPEAIKLMPALANKLFGDNSSENLKKVLDGYTFSIENVSSYAAIKTLPILYQAAYGDGFQKDLQFDISKPSAMGYLIDNGKIAVIQARIDMHKDYGWDLKDKFGSNIIINYSKKPNPEAARLFLANASYYNKKKDNSLDCIVKELPSKTKKEIFGNKTDKEICGEILNNRRKIILNARYDDQVNMVRSFVRSDVYDESGDVECKPGILFVRKDMHFAENNKDNIFSFIPKDARDLIMLMSFGNIHPVLGMLIIKNNEEMLKDIKHVKTLLAPKFDRNFIVETYSKEANKSSNNLIKIKPSGESRREAYNKLHPSQKAKPIEKKIIEQKAEENTNGKGRDGR